VGCLSSSTGVSLFVSKGKNCERSCVIPSMMHSMAWRVFFLVLIAATPSTLGSILPVHCRVVELDVTQGTLFGGVKGEKEKCVCMPLINGTESDDMLAIDLPGGMELDCADKSDDQGGVFIYISNATVSSNIVTVHSGATISFLDPPERRELSESKTLGRRSILMLRVSTLDSEPATTATEFEERVFGVSSHTMTSQYERCSFGKLTFELAFGGAIDLVISKSITDFQTRLELVNAVQEEARVRLQVDKLSDSADHVMMCLPPGLEGGWVAFAGVGDWRSAYNSHYCGIISVSMHEMGHNLGLRHSNENGDYMDSTGYMGAARDNEVGPIKCFNAEKNWRLGWYGDRALQIEPIADGPQLIELAAFVDYDKTNDNQHVLINVGNRYFLQFNRAKGPNFQTEEKKGMVTIVQHVQSDGSSEMLAGLHPTSKPLHYIIDEFGNGYVFQVCQQILSADESKPDIMIVSIGIETSLCGDPGDFQEMLANVPRWKSVVKKRQKRVSKGEVKLGSRNNGNFRRGIRG
jgi:hypothetical protein